MDFSWLEIVLALVAVLFALYMYGTWNFDKFKKDGVPHLQPAPFLGNLWPVLLGIDNMQYGLDRVYYKFPEHRYVGFYFMSSPALIIRDPDLIRKIAIKDFDHFADRPKMIDEKIDPIFGSNLMALTGQKWRDMRATLSPAFTGSKMRIMYKLVSECAQQTAEYLKKVTAETGRTDLDMKRFFTTYTNDVIATSAFGIKVDSLQNPDNDFYRMGKKATSFSGKMFIKFMGFTMMPKIMKMLEIKLFDSDCSDFFHDLLHGTIAVREKEGIIRPDMVHLLMQAKQGTLQHETDIQQQDAGFATVTESDVGTKQTQKREWTDVELTAQAMIFFLAGFEPTATALCFTCHELAVNPEVQKKLQEEVDELRAENESPGYEAINRMKYLDMVVSESLRMWPATGVLNRISLKPYVLEDHEGGEYQMKKDEAILIPILQLHHDEKYYKNPERFDPERFNEENKKNIKPFTYLPFGIGPRNCIGSRFALMELKAVLFHILSHFKLEPCVKTQIPIKLSSKSVTMTPKNGFWLSIVSRT